MLEDAGMLGQVIGNLGFPIFVAVYLLVFMRRSLDQLTEALNNLASRLDRES